MSYYTNPWHESTNKVRPRILQFPHNNKHLLCHICSFEHKLILSIYVKVLRNFLECWIELSVIL